MALEKMFVDAGGTLLVGADPTGNGCVVAGYGTSGTQTVDELIARGADPKKIVVIDPNNSALTRAEDLGCAAIQADATKDEALLAVRLDQARAMMISAGLADPRMKIEIEVTAYRPSGGQR